MRYIISLSPIPTEQRGWKFFLSQSILEKLNTKFSKPHNLSKKIQKESRAKTHGDGHKQQQP